MSAHRLVILVRYWMPVVRFTLPGGALLQGLVGCGRTRRPTCGLEVQVAPQLRMGRWGVCGKTRKAGERRTILTAHSKEEATIGNCYAAQARPPSPQDGRKEVCLFF